MCLSIEDRTARAAQLEAKGLTNRAAKAWALIASDGTVPEKVRAAAWRRRGLAPELGAEPVLRRPPPKTAEQREALRVEANQKRNIRNANARQAKRLAEEAAEIARLGLTREQYSTLIMLDIEQARARQSAEQ